MSTFSTNTFVVCFGMKKLVAWLIVLPGPPRTPSSLVVLPARAARDAA